MSVIKTRGGCRFATKALEVCSGRPLTKPENFQCDCAIETLLSSEINYALSAATNLVQQLVVAKFSRQHRYALSTPALLAFGLSGGLLLLIQMRSKPALKKTTWTGSLWCV